MSKAVVDKLVEFFRPQTPFWACELTPRHVIVAGVSRDRSRVKAKLPLDLAPNTVSGSLNEANIRNPAALRAALSEALNSSGFEGSEIVVVLPDEATRIAFLNVEKLAKDPQEQETFIRWKLKKTVPFDVDSAQIGFRVLGRHHSGSGMDIMVTLSPRSIVQEYENLFNALNLQAGLILPSTIATTNLFQGTTGDALFLKISPDCITTTVFQHGRVQFYRRISEASLYDAAYPTIMYYQDKLGGTGLERIIVCDYDSENRSAIADLQEKIGLSIHHLGPKNIDDIFKPVLGAVHFSERVA